MLIRQVGSMDSTRGGGGTRGWGVGGVGGGVLGGGVGTRGGGWGGVLGGGVSLTDALDMEFIFWQATYAVVTIYTGV